MLENNEREQRAENKINANEDEYGVHCTRDFKGCSRIPKQKNDKEDGANDHGADSQVSQ